MLGTTIGNYAVTAKIGEGGMGAVYRAEHAMLGRRAAVKVLLPELSNHRDIVARFFNEARALTALRHPSIVEMFDFGYLPDGSAYIVMEYLEGESLAARVRRLHRLDPRAALLLVRQIAGALAVAHERSIVHRDLKPDNIFVVPDPEVPGGERIKVLDFGIAKLATPGDMSRTQTGSVLGTPRYMSPEQCRGAGSVDARADLYALGCVLYEMVLGRPPFVAEGAGDIIAHHLYFPPPPPRSLDPALPEAYERLVLWLLEKDPAARPQTARDLIDAIDRLAAGSGNFASAAASMHDQPTVLVQSLTGSAAAGLPPAMPRQPTPAVPMPVVAQQPAPMFRPATAAGAAPTTTLSGATGDALPLMAYPGRRRWLIPAVAGTLIAAGAAIAFAVGSGDRGKRTEAPVAATPEPPATPATRPAPPVMPLPEPAPAAPPVIEKVTLAIESEPAGAEVLVAGAKLGATPFAETLDRADGKRVYTVQKPGYEPETVTLPTDHGNARKLTLKKKHRVVRPPRGSADGVGDQGVNPFD